MNSLFEAIKTVSPLLLVFYSVAAVLFILGVLFLRNTFPSSSDRSVNRHERRRKRRTAGVVLVAAAAIALANGLLTQFYPSAGAGKDANSTTSTSTIKVAPQPKMGDAHPVSPTTPGSAVTAQDSGNASTSDSLPFSPPKQLPPLLQEAKRLLEQDQVDLALEKLNAYLAVNPGDSDANALRGQAHVEKDQWELAQKDFEAALAADPSRVKLKFNLAELQFVQNKFDTARTGFAALVHDPDCGDLAAYKVYLCDLYGGHEDVAAKELTEFDQVDTNASHYFANAAACLYYGKSDEARTWLTSADHIFSNAKFHLYADSLAGKKTSRNAGGNPPSEAR